MPIASKTTVAESVFHKFYQKPPIEVPWILLTTHTNIGKLTVARTFLAQPNLGKFTVAHFVLHNFRFWKKALISNNSLMRTLFCTNMVNLKMFARLWLNKPIKVNLQMACAVFHNVNVFRILVTKGAYFKETQSCAECFDAYFKQNHTCAESFGQVLSKMTFQCFRQVFDLRSQFRQNCSWLTVFHNL